MLKYMKFLVVALAVAAVSVPAVASAHGHSRVFVGVGFGGYYGPPAYYPYPAYYPAPAYYYPPPAYISPAPPAPYSSSYCRQFNGDATIDASGGPFYGTACLGGDGKWHISR
jgi:hypothetical protein